MSQFTTYAIIDNESNKAIAFLEESAALERDLDKKKDRENYRISKMVEAEKVEKVEGTIKEKILEILNDNIDFLQTIQTQTEINPNYQFEKLTNLIKIQKLNLKEDLKSIIELL